MPKSREQKVNRFEERIRDFLSVNLNVIELDLTIIAKEYKLANEFGSGGSVDILARDGLGHYVVIEVKRSNQVARAALHELTKYVALLRSSLGVPAEKIRALLVSTEWDELAVPFSEYQKISEVPTEGYVISAAESGEVFSCNRFAPVFIDQGLSISRQQSLVLYKNSKNRNDGISIVTSAAIKSQLSDFVVLTADYEGEGDRVVYPFGLYFGFSSPITDPESEGAKRIIQELDWDEYLDDPDENFLSALMSNISGHSAVELGHPEKIKLMDEQGWSISVAVRNGRYKKNAELLSNEQLLTEFSKSEGGANYYLQSTSSPKYPPSWNKFKDDVAIVLMGNEKWESFFAALTAEVEVESSSSTVSISLYNLGNIVFGLSKIYGENDFRYMPRLQIVVSGEKHTVLYEGQLIWNRTPITMSAEEWMEDSYDSLQSYFIMHALGEQYMNEDLACEGLGLEYAIYKVVNPGKQDEAVYSVAIKNGGVVSTPFSQTDLFSIEYFLNAHVAFGKRLVSIVKEYSVGMIN
jgi:hypothetical protein